MKTNAVLDRFEGNQAVLLVGDDEERLVVDRAALPKGVREGHWLKISVEHGRLMSAEIDEKETEAARARIAEKLESLRRGDHLR